MKDQYLKLADIETKKAIAFDCKEMAAMQLGETVEAMRYQKMAAHHRSESKKYLEAG